MEAVAEDLEEDSRVNVEVVDSREIEVEAVEATKEKEAEVVDTRETEDEVDTREIGAEEADFKVNFLP